MGQRTCPPRRNRIQHRLEAGENEPDQRCLLTEPAIQTANDRHFRQRELQYVTISAAKRLPAESASLSYGSRFRRAISRIHHPESRFRFAPRDAIRSYAADYMPRDQAPYKTRSTASYDHKTAGDLPLSSSRSK